MIVYVAHATSYDFVSHLYTPLKTIPGDFEFILPHASDVTFNSKDAIRTADVVLAEVTRPSTGVGIELGWANMVSVPIVCVHETKNHPSSALTFVCSHFIAYDNSEELISKLPPELQRYKKT